MNTSELVLFGSLALVALLLLALSVMLLRERWRWKRRYTDERAKLAAVRQRFASIVDADEKAQRIVSSAEAIAEDRMRRAEAAVAALETVHAATSKELEQLKASYAQKRAVFDRLATEVAIFDERIAFAEMGVYEPHFDFDDSEAFKQALAMVRERQKDLVSRKVAVVCHKNWTVDGSAALGKTMTDRNIRLTLRAFNSECDAAVANIRWNNANAMEKRVENARTQIDKHNASNAIVVTDQYFQLKLDELRLTHEYREKLKAEREERAELARLAKEEDKLLREMERAEDEEARYQRMLEKARSEAASVVGPKLEAYSQQIALLERELNEAHAKAERARAMAEMTRSGYVYIISNIGSFGPDLVKIGLTRRLDPADRIRELGDASVPFLFDTHAVIYSDNAPSLECALHTEFAALRVNATNMRKEFFRVSIEDVELAVRRLAPEANFFRDIEAQEYHETLALRTAHLSQQVARDELAFPETI